MLPKSLLERDPGLDTWSILTAYRGSIAHGMFDDPKKKPDSVDDKDLLAVCVPPRDYYFGLKEYGSRGTKEIKQDEWDVVIYEARKFISLLAKGNPNILSILWTPARHLLRTTHASQLLFEHRHLFVGQHAYHSFIGYAHGQLHRMEHWKPSDTAYAASKRLANIERSGYDTKHGAHLVRLLRMGIEFLKTGDLIVERPDNNELLEIKRGERSLAWVKDEADRLFKLAEEAYVRSTLPTSLDIERINQLAVEVVEQAWEERGV